MSAFAQGTKILSFFFILSFIVACAKETEKTSGGTASLGSAPSSAPVSNEAGLTTRIQWQGMGGVNIIANNATVNAFRDSNSSKGTMSPFCFENSNTSNNVHCKRPEDSLLNSPAGSVSGDNGVDAYLPMVIHNFRLNFSPKTYLDSSYSSQSYNYNEVVIEAASFTTHELGFNPNNGNMILSSGIKVDLKGSCVLGEANTVGVAQNDVDNLSIISMLAFYENNLFPTADSSKFDQEAHQNTAYYGSSLLKAGRVEYSGIVPLPAENATNKRFKWNFYNQQIASSIFGSILMAGFNSSFDLSGLGGLTHDSNYTFGWNSSSSHASKPSRWDSHVLTGFCIKGYKRFVNNLGQTIVRPLVPGVSYGFHKAQLIE